MPIVSLIAAFLISPIQGAPIDVPKSHWAHDAVHALFREGLLKGYPSGQSGVLRLDEKATLSYNEALELFKRWEQAGIIGDYLPQLTQREIATVIYAAWVNLREALGGNGADSKMIQAFRKEIPVMAHAISAYKSDIAKLKVGNPRDMIDALNDILDRSNHPF